MSVDTFASIITQESSSIIESNGIYLVIQYRSTGVS